MVFVCVFALFPPKRYPYFFYSHHLTRIDPIGVCVLASCIPSKIHEIMSLFMIKCLINIGYLILLILIIIPISSLMTFLYVIIQPFQACNLLPTLMQFLFHNFVSLPKRCCAKIFGTDNELELPTLTVSTEEPASGSSRTPVATLKKTTATTTTTKNSIH